jgi:branched-chain amino acid transport system ATP-binding protein
MLKVDNLTIHYGGIPAVRDLSIELDQQELVALIGANGAGKTTLLNSIMGIKSAKAGVILLDDVPVTNLPSWERVKLGISLVPEGGRIFPDLLVEQNLRVGAYHKVDKSEVDKSLAEVYGLFPVLEERKKQIAGTLSGGERQLLAIGRAVMAVPRVLLVDEISMGLMPKLVPQVFSIISELRDRGMSVLLAEQNVKEALPVADRGYVLENGRVVLSGKAEELEREDLVRKAYLGI